MEELVHNVIPNCSLSQLTALESIIAALVQQGKLSAVNLMKQAVMFVGSATMQLRTAKSELSKFKNTGGDDSSQATQDQLTGLLESFSRERRSTFTLISMLTAAQPTALVAAYVPVLLDLGLAVDPLVSWAVAGLNWYPRCACSMCVLFSLVPGTHLVTPVIGSDK